MLSPYHPLQLALAFIVWCVYFVVIYAALSVACSVAPPAQQLGAFNWLNVALMLFTLLTAAWLFYQAWYCRRIAAEADPASETEQERRDAGSNQLHGFRGFMGSLAAGANFVAGLATLAIGAPLAVMTPCV